MPINLFPLVFIGLLSLAILEFSKYRSFKKKIFYDILLRSKRKKQKFIEDTIVLYSIYSSFTPEQLRESKLKVRSIIPDSFIKQVVTTLFAALPIVLSFTSIVIATTTGLFDIETLSDLLTNGIIEMTRMTIAIVGVALVFMIHIKLEHRKQMILISHLAAIEEVERERSN